MAFQGWNYGDMFDAVGSVVAPDQPALIHGDRLTTWREFVRRTNNLGRALVVGGAQPGDKLAFYLRNHAAFLEGVVAGFKARLVHVNVNYRYIAEEVAYIFDNSDASVVVFAREFSPIVTEVRDRLPKVRRWLLVEDGTDQAAPTFAEPFEGLAAEGSGAPLEITRSPDDLFMNYTGGTTGLPKGVVWRQDSLRRALLTPALAARTPQNLDDHLDDIQAAGRGPAVLPACPLMHGTGLVSGLSALIAGGTVVTLETIHLDPSELLRAVDKHRVERIVIVGDAFAKPMLRALDEEPGRYDLSSVRSIMSSGVIWSTEVKQAMLRHLPQATLLDAFGSSEAIGFGLSTMSAGDGPAVETARFKVGEGVKVFSPDGREIPPGTGEAGLIARSGPLPEGYYKDQKKTDEAYKVIDGVRYAIPGDFCRVDADGNLTLLGRGSGCINTAGEKVFPEEVEEVLKLHPDIEDALVIGIPDEKWGQSVTGIVELRSGAHFDEASIHEHTRKRLAGYKTPKRLIEVTRMPRAPNGKADYASVRAVALRKLGVIV
jgi:acyl-CoA synthetase (AMP-forming)/AMP-acid ligase II